MCLSVSEEGGGEGRWHDERKDSVTDSFGIRKIQNLQTQI